MAGDDMASRSKPRPGIQSVEIAAQILRALIAARRPVPLKELAKLARMHPGKTHRYLVSLTRTDLVHQDEASGHYGIGPMAIALGLAGLRNVDVVRTSAALLPALRDEINETVLLALWSAQGPVVFDLEQSSRPVYMNIRVGSILPLITTATGRVFAAFLSRDEVTALLEAECAEARKARLPWGDAARVQHLLEETRKLGLAHVEGDLVPGVNAVAAPLFDHKDRIAGVIGALGRTEELDVSFEGPVAQALRRTATEISWRLGRSAAAES
jgi:DNA-binding IclR family transcriptional regulator